MTQRAEINFDLDPAGGAEITGWEVVARSIERLITTVWGQRALREHVGSNVPAALGRNLTEETVLDLWIGIAMVIELFEPRFQIKRFLPVEVSRTGKLRLRIEGEYVPRALVGDDSIRAPTLFETRIS